ncbi:uncharacterized protein A1O5_02605 [Cladophialophora psammophila CBS 110553]|uniref:FAD-binding domain-containing protein n=1 Tax=Cladophialophora psammophila CBS 110553 TaxID=1182543 RepID=W9XVM4_9EURO|nr:uncharacterized protein A1O5_02605 [Cladophialophora psammophila CBS 110553]EXJ74309.1 hypothetical protein A1O5_02605 [Cladophialophora psammophila CBS 110553]
MATLEPATKVLIVGSGLSGVALAQILRNGNVQFEIFERDDGTRSQGWTIGLDECLEGLYRLLPTDLPELASSSPNFHRKDTMDCFTIMDGPSHQILGLTKTKHEGENLPILFVNRLKFREVLKTHLNVQYSKQFVRYEEDHDGVTAYFKDGTSARGHILVGADGSNSPVRAQFLQGFKPDSSPFLTALGRVVLSKDLYEPLLEHSANGILAGGPDQKTYCLLMEYLDNDTAIFNWTVSWRSSNLEEDYAKTVEAGPAAQLEMARQRMKDWPPAMVNALAQCEPSDLQWPPVRLMETVLPPRNLPRGRVTLIGDAAHSMVPFRGMGANTALLDACDLGEGLIKGIQEKEDLQWVLQLYEQIMIPRGRNKVLESRATADSDDAREIAGGRIDEAQASSHPIPLR